MANISHRLGKRHSQGEIAERFRGNATMTDALGRMQEHLAANDVRVDGSTLTLGPRLKFRPGSERFSGDYAKEANALLMRAYREPFVIREKV
jgi:hypothetical protein